jgi:hypothetical protein
MDRTRLQRGLIGPKRSWALLLLLAASAARLAGADTPSPSPLAARWTLPGRLEEVLTSEPADCRNSPADPAEAARVAIGAAVFRAPLLLGGQAARSGLSCNSCHRGGHDNPGFSYPGLSGEPGTADVTSSLFSSHRGDGTFNPRPIPDLSGPKAALRIDQTRGTGRLEGFIHGLITEEFDGPEPPLAVLDGLAAYVRALDPAACRAPVRLDLASALARVDAALDAAERRAQAGDGASARLLVSAARSELGLIDERYSRQQATGLRRAATALGKIERNALGDPQGAATALQRWRSAQPGWTRALHAAEAQSLYNPVVLRRALGAR